MTTLVTRINELAARIATEVNTLRTEIASSGGASGVATEIDGGRADTLYGGALVVDGGDANGD